MAVVQMQSARRARKHHGHYVITRPNHTTRGTFTHKMIKAALTHRTVEGAERALEAVAPGRKIDWGWLKREGYVAFLD